MNRKIKHIILLIIAGFGTTVSATAAPLLASGMNDPIMWVVYAIAAILLLIAYLLYVVSNKLKRFIQDDGTLEIYEKRNFWEKIFQLKPTETDKDTIIDEAHDGIYELDNPPPPWFMFLFYSCIVFAVIYFVRFSVLKTRLNQDQEYAIAMQKAEEAKATSVEDAGEDIDERNVEILLAAADIDKGRSIYNQNCKVCHDADGKGGVGPNLTDEFWIHGGGVQNVFKIIKYGAVEKGMRSWKDDLNPKMMQQVTSYILSLQGTNPPGAKGPEGAKWIEEATSVPATDDETSEEDNSEI